ncbi:NADH dehydrogenase (ubiquinone) complex I, assembly factor 6 [Geranomyces michiganensis]|nr:NADH dehydrogenase (ubiquinone) complex I, assembly factor 6 [Geranomyces michiganensis]
MPLRPSLLLTSSASRITSGRCIARTRCLGATSSAYLPPRRPASSASTSTVSQTAYISSLLRKADYENYLATLFTPASSRQAVWAVRAFNVETALIRENVKNPQLGVGRIAWWRDAIDKVYSVRSAFLGTPPVHPVAQSLSLALETAPLSKSWFKRILSEREANLQDPQYANIADLERYAENTASALLYLQLEALGLQNPQADHAASHVGKAIGIATILRATPFHIEQRRFYLPSELMAKHGVAAETVLRSGPSPALEEVVFEVATAANDHLITARSFLKESPPAAHPALLSAVPAELYLQALERSNFNLFDPKLGKRNWRLPFRLWSSARNKTI